jgi:hypothetical protein
MPGRGGRRRDRVSGPLAALAVVLAVFALLLSYAGRAVLRPQPFADRVVATLRDPAVQADVADRLTAGVVRAGGADLAAVRPLIRAVAGTIVGSEPFAALVRRAALEVHAAVVRGRPGPVVVNVADAAVLVQAALDRFAPQVAQRVGAERVVDLGSFDPGGGVRSAVRVTRHVYMAAWVLAVVALLSALAAWWLSADRRRTLQHLGAGLALGGLVLAALYLLGRAVVGQVAGAGRGQAAIGLWSGFVHGLFVQALWMAAAGVVLAAVATASEGAAPGRPDRDTPPTPRARLARSLLLILGGAIIVLEPGAAVSLAASVAGLFIVYKGVEGVVAVAGGARSGAPSAPSASGARWRVRRFLAVVAGPVIAVAALATAATIVVTGGGDEAAAVAPATCDLSPALCDRPLNDVAMAATHNSMASVTIKSWLFGQQDGTIADQLKEGIRGLLIDTYYGFPVKRGVRTDLSTVPKRALAEQEIGPEAVKAAERIRARLGDSTPGPRQIYLCHGFCELGAVTLSSALADVRAFLVSHPGEVVTVINQDEGVTPADIDRAFDQAGLLDLVYRGPLGPFPTLRQMIDSGQRLVVMAENDAGNVPWYHLAYAHALQETPFTFKTAAALTDESQLPASCRDNRGPASAPLFLVNNWVDTTPVPRASLADVVNQRAVLLRRAQTCQRLRHRLPNLVAVDFYRRGDVLGVVRALNGLPAQSG